MRPAKSFSDAHSSDEEQASPINEVEDEEAEVEQEEEADGPEEEEKEEVKEPQQSSIGSLNAQYHSI